MKNTKSQASIELIITVGFMILIFIIMVSLSIEKSRESNEIRMFLDARSIMERVADNINTISEQGPGFYRYFSIPEKINSDQDYQLAVYENIVEITWDKYVLSTPVITLNATILELRKGLTERNCVLNKDGHLCIRHYCADISILLYSPYYDARDHILLDNIAVNCNINVTFSSTVADLEDVNSLRCYDVLWMGYNSISGSDDNNLTSDAEQSIRDFVSDGGKLWSSSQENNSWNDSWRWLAYYTDISDFEDNDSDIPIPATLFSEPNTIDPDDLLMGQPFISWDAGYDVLAYVENTTSYAQIITSGYGVGQYLISSIDVGSDPSYDAVNADMFENAIKYLDFKFKCN